MHLEAATCLIMYREWVPAMGPVAPGAFHPGQEGRRALNDCAVEPGQDPPIDGIDVMACGGALGAQRAVLFSLSSPLGNEV